MAFEARDYHTEALHRVFASPAFKDFKAFTAILPHATQQQIKALFRFFRKPISTDERVYITVEAFISQRLSVLYLFIFPILFSSLLQRYSSASTPEKETIKNEIAEASTQFFSLLDDYLRSTNPKITSTFKDLLRAWCTDQHQHSAESTDATYTVLIQIFSLWPMPLSLAETLCALASSYPSTSDDLVILAQSQYLTNILSAYAFLSEKKVCVTGETFSLGDLAPPDSSPTKHDLKINPLRHHVGHSLSNRLIEKIIHVLDPIPNKSANDHQRLQIIRAHIAYQQNKFNEFFHAAMEVLNPDNFSTSSLTSTQRHTQLSTLLSAPISSALEALAKLRAIAEVHSHPYSPNEKTHAIKQLYRKATKNLNAIELSELNYLLKEPENKRVLSFLRALPSNSSARGWKLHTPLKTSMTPTASSSRTNPGIIAQLCRFLTGCFTCFRSHAEVAQKAQRAVGAPLPAGAGSDGTTFYYQQATGSTAVPAHNSTPVVITP